jgi:hypothetical protein
MAHRPIKFNSRPLSIHKATVAPQFNERTVLLNDTWDYIDLWLKREKQNRARFFWSQSRHFFEASKALPKESSPLTSYYCMLNAAKALLIIKKLAPSAEHGVTGEGIGKKNSISNEEVTFKTGGVLGLLCEHMDEKVPVGHKTYKLHHLLYNLPYIHRTFNISFPSLPELFTAIRNPCIVRSNSTNEAWFQADLTTDQRIGQLVKKLGKPFELDIGVTTAVTVRSTKRFYWRNGQTIQNIERYTNYHKLLRKRLSYIYGAQKLWYIKRSGVNEGLIDRSPMIIAFAAMHRLSELARYSPDELASHFDGRYNWLLTDFISVAPSQFIDNISSEITGQEFMPPWRATG